MVNSVRSSLSLSAMLLVCGGTIATAQAQEITQSQQQVYGRELMIEEEYAAHHYEMRAAKTKPNVNRYASKTTS